MTLLLALLCTGAQGGIGPTSSPDPLLQPGAWRPGEPVPPTYALQPDGRIGATLWLYGLDPGRRRDLESHGVRFRHDDEGQVVHVGEVYPVEGTLESLWSLAAAGHRVELARWVDLWAPPTKVTGELVQAHDLWAAGPWPGPGYRGQGLRLFDLDPGMDIYHPHFFRADAGALPWVDVDGDGELTPGEDGVDLDGDAEIGPGEVLHLIDTWASWYDHDLGISLFEGVEGPLDPARDYLYLDLDRNGHRDFGPDDGFDEADPAYGEPLFVPDDADVDGVLEPDERVVQLGTSVVRMIREDGRVYTRGEDLIEYPSWTYELAYHATGVGGILAGGQYPPARAYGSLAPEAELLMFSTLYSDTSDFVDAMYWGQRKGADVALHEYAPWSGYHLDGSSGIEAAVDTLVDEGMVHVCPTGNLADSGKHTHGTTDGGSFSLSWEAPESYYGQPFYYLELNLHLDDPEVGVDCLLTDPGGSELGVDFAAGSGTLDELLSWQGRSTSPRDTELLVLWLWSEAAGVTVDQGTWTLDCDHDQESELVVHAYLDDYTSGWGRGIVFHDETKASTMGIPSTSDLCIAVGAYAGRWRDESALPGELRSWSSRGPSWDGRRTLDVAAPDDPFAPQAYHPEQQSPDSVYWAFGGTSGASPHVTAVAGLMVQADPELSPLEVRQAIRDGALVDEQVGGITAPHDGWGHGKVQGYTAVYDALPPSPPEAPVPLDLELLPVPTLDGCGAWAHASSTDYPEALFRWDLDYDGAWDSGPGEGLVEVPVGAEGVAVRVDAMVDGWWVGGAARSMDLLDLCYAGDQEEVRSCGCASSTLTGGVPPLLGLLTILARRRRI